MPGKVATLCKEQTDRYKSSGTTMYIVEGHDIVLEMGSSRTIVLQDMVALEKVIVGKVATMTCAHGDTKVHPLAEVKLELEGVHICVEAALAEELPSIRN